MKKFTLFSLTTVASVSLFAQSLSISVLPALEVPLGTSAELYSGGGGAEVSAVYGPGSGSGLRLSGALGYRALTSLASEPLSLASLGAGIGYQLGAGPRLAFTADLRGGGYFGAYGSGYRARPLRGGGRGPGPRTQPGLSSGNGSVGYLFPLGASKPVYSGLGVRFLASFTPGASKTAQPKLQIIDPKFEPVFPVFFKWYDSNPAGSVVIVNKESRPIKNVKASIFIREFMDAPKVFAEIPSLGKGESKEVPVLALLTDKVLGVTESTKVAAEITVSYDLADGTLKVMRVETLRVLDRNAMTWADDQRAASFVTARDPVLLTLAKNVAGAVRESGGAGSDLDLRIAMGMYQALGLYGMKYVIDPASSYADFSQKETAVDFLQFPRQTLQYKSGDCDDLTILYAALLESVGIETAFVTVPGHILSAVALPMTPDEAERTFSRLDRYIVDKGKVFIPVEATMFGKGFNAAWAEGARQWRLAGTAARLIPVREAWKTYEAVGLREDAPSLAYPSARAVVASYKGELDRFVSDELVPQVARLQEEIKRSGATSKNLNRLGVLYARYGKYAEAEAEFQKVIKRDEYVPTLVNLANIALINGEKKAAASWLDRALKKDPANKGALAGAVRVRSELGDQAAAQKHLASAEGGRLRGCRFPCAPASPGRGRPCLRRGFGAGLLERRVEGQDSIEAATAAPRGAAFFSRQLAECGRIVLVSVTPDGFLRFSPALADFPARSSSWRTYPPSSPSPARSPWSPAPAGGWGSRLPGAWRLRAPGWC